MFDIDNPFAMVPVIVFIVFGAGLIKMWIETRANSGADTETRARLTEMEDEVLRLRDRVKTLEKIATDKDRNLRDEISRLA